MIVRDPNRIYKFCNKIAEMWSEVPDWRFGQLISNITANFDGASLFYLEDEELFKRLEEEFNKFKNN